MSKLKLQPKDVDMNIICKCDKNDMERLNLIIKNQNKILLRHLSIHYKWSYDELCKKYLCS